MITASKAAERAPFECELSSVSCLSCQKYKYDQGRDHRRESAAGTVRINATPIKDTPVINRSLRSLFTEPANNIPSGNAS
jgi:hypothetical protein